MWIKVYDTLPGHPKTKALARELGVTINSAVGYLVSLWCWAMRYCPDGNLAGVADTDLADAMNWTDAPEDLRAALVSTEYVSQSGHLTNWSRYYGSLHIAKKQRMYRLRKKKALRNGRPYSSVTVAPERRGEEKEKEKREEENKTKPIKQLSADQDQPAVEETERDDFGFDDQNHKRELTPQQLDAYLADAKWGVVGIPPKQWPIAQQLAPYSQAELDNAKAKTEAKSKRPNAGLFFAILRAQREKPDKHAAALEAWLQEDTGNDKT